MRSWVASNTVSAASVSHCTFQSISGPHAGSPAAGGWTHPPITITVVSRSVPGRLISSSARFVQGPIATTTAPSPMFVARSSAAAPSGDRAGATMASPQ